MAAQSSWYRNSISLPRLGRSVPSVSPGGNGFGRLPPTFDQPGRKQFARQPRACAGGILFRPRAQTHPRLPALEGEFYLPAQPLESQHASGREGRSKRSPNGNIRGSVPAFPAAFLWPLAGFALQTAPGQPGGFRAPLPGEPPPPHPTAPRRLDRCAPRWWWSYFQTAEQPQRIDAILGQREQRQGRALPAHHEIGFPGRHRRNAQGRRINAAADEEIATPDRHPTHGRAPCDARQLAILALQMG
jgi:hypothetical protein